MKRIGELAGDRALERDMVDHGAIPQPLDFTVVTTYTTFTAEYAFDGDGEDLVYHFFVPPEGVPRVYWLEGGVFPRMLEETVTSFFPQRPPQVRASYTEENASWWLRVDGAGLSLDKEARAEAFLQRLDSALDAAALETKKSIAER